MGRPASRKTGSAIARTARSANRTALANRLPSARSDPSIESVDKEKTHHQACEEPHQPKRNTEAEQRSDSESGAAADQDRGDQHEARGCRVGSGRGSLIHRDVEWD